MEQPNMHSLKWGTESVVVHRAGSAAKNRPKMENSQVCEWICFYFNNNQTFVF